MDFPTSIAIAVGTITAGGLALRLFNNNKSKIGDKDAISSKDCSDYRAAIKEDLDRGKTEFHEIQADLKEQSIMLARIDERTQKWAKKNGFEHE